ncbi:AfsR/SARP family transcriptional regulator [Streptomyces aureoverticillatus]|uniref:AfsR/SARP family transcriptional regulator n=1 Tax=Streptomyces aureoverticillatus TaxID=66871 RepID=UPI0013DAACC4|nr:AfsR/SARP family transcriptional regulator [Streptomyces aureoverticillatus]QIB41739.1 AfsR/SARP family transcriptional regulator [Streptomyces aureoverticillatus]QIB48402.1 AfsR/SARP family transcriptional regulator [Streptomyces aureoverticillatus]
MDIDVLGALQVRVHGISITPTAPKPRQVLALLALHADQVVPVGSLIGELWADSPPRSARTTLQTYVLQLRERIARALAHDSTAPGPGAPGGTAHNGTAQSGAARDAAQHRLTGGQLAHRGAQPHGAAVRCAKEVLVTTPNGYRLCAGGGRSDVREFERLAGTGYRAMDAGDFAGAARQLGQALGLFSGAVLADVRAGVLLEMEVRRLEESRLCALDQRIEADLRLGRHRELLAELTVLVSRYRTHESLHGQFMLALHRSGRRGEALEVYQRLRSTLVKDLGLEPSAGLRRLQHSILTTGPDTRLPAPRPGGDTPLVPAG